MMAITEVWLWLWLFRRIRDSFYDGNIMWREEKSAFFVDPDSKLFTGDAGSMIQQYLSYTSQCNLHLTTFILNISSTIPYILIHPVVSIGTRTSTCRTYSSHIFSSIELQQYQLTLSILEAASSI